jgi:hypothetical protein
MEKQNRNRGKDSDTIINQERWNILSAEFDTSKNEKPLSSYGPYSNKKVFWICSEKHSFAAILCNRYKGTGCPYCSGRIVCTSNCLATTHPSLALEWHPTKNTCTPSEITAGSNKQIWWKCSKNTTHEWTSTPNARTRKSGGTGCPHCNGKTTADGNTLEEKFPSISAEWHPTLNTMSPSSVCPRSDKQVWWMCPLGHSYEAKIANRTGDRKTGCSICAGKVVTDDNSFATHYPSLASEWHPTKNDCSASYVTRCSGKMIWWKCLKNSSHEWESSISNRAKGHGCPLCSGRKPTEVRNLAILSPHIATEWHPTKNGTLTPEDCNVASHSIVWWKCSKKADHIWLARISNRTTGNETGCPHCKMSHMEKAMESYFILHNIIFEPQKKFRGLGALSYDFYIPECNACIECDGRQHFENILGYFHHQKSLLHQRKRDIRKNAFAIQKNMSLLRIAYTEEKQIPTILSAFLERIRRTPASPCTVFVPPFLYSLKNNLYKSEILEETGNVTIEATTNYTIEAHL